MGWATITHPFHPFHPLRGQCFEVLKTRTAAGIKSLLLRHPHLGSYAVAEKWTDWGSSDLLAGVDTPPRKLDAEALLQLTLLLAEVDRKSQKELDT